jgi:hypothetical protein
MPVLKLPFGLRPDGRLVDVTQVERGRACNCRCPGCGELLLAKKGEVNVQHFSHQSGAECAAGAETALHMAAKQLVADKRWIRLPPLEVHVTRVDPECGLFDVRKFFGISEVWKFDKVTLEMAVGDVRPDAVGIIGATNHGVEIRVAHEVDAEKQAYLGLLNLPSIEVDLAALVGKVFTFEALEEIVLKSIDNKKWLFHPRQAEWEASMMAGFDAWRLARLAELSYRAPPRARAPVPAPTREDAYRAANGKYRALPLTEKWLRLERHLGLQRSSFPRHMRVALREGSDVVMVDRDLWQGALFAQFVLGTSENPKRGSRMPNTTAIGAWLSQRFGVRGSEASAAKAARSYLSYLQACGFLRWQAGSFIVVHDQLDVPPKVPMAPSPFALRALPAPNTAIQWRKHWPDYERMREWAAELAQKSCDFDSGWFVDWLLRLQSPATLDEVQEAFEHAGGNPAKAETVLRGLGVVTQTWRYFSYGDPAPWIDV